GAGGTAEAAPGLARGVDLAPIVLLALLRVADNAIGVGDLLEALLGGAAVGGVEIGVQLLGELAVGATNVVLGSGPRHAQHHVGVVGHPCSSIPAVFNPGHIARCRLWRLYAKRARRARGHRERLTKRAPPHPAPSVPPGPPAGAAGARRRGRGAP